MRPPKTISTPTAKRSGRFTDGIAPGDIAMRHGVRILDKDWPV
jgi:hypothetical protein